MHDPDSLVTRDHWVTHKPGCGSAPPPLHVIPLNADTIWTPAPRPQNTAGSEAGPALIIGGTGLPSLGIDPTDNTTWEGRGYRQCAGMIGRLNSPDDWHGFQPIGAQGVRPA